MEINIKDLLEDVEFLNVNENISIDTNQNTIIFGSNGIGKTTIYNALKNNYKEFDYLDYEETKDIFKKNKKKIELSLGINKLEDLRQKVDKCNESLLITSKLKAKDISSKAKAKAISNKLSERYGNKYFSKINISDNDFFTINEVRRYIKYIVSNYEDLKSITDIDDELQLVDQNYLKRALKLLDSKITEETTICPICGSEVPDLKKIIQTKLKVLSKIKNKCLKEFISEFEVEIGNDKIKDEFDRILDAVKKVNEENIVDYFIIDGSKEEMKKVNEAVNNKITINKEIEQCLNMQKELFSTLITQKELYTDYLKNNFDANVNFDENKKLVTIEFNRNVDTFSTGEINIILFITKLFGFLGSEKNLLIIDDPISSYDLVNQYHIVFHLCKIVSSRNKHVVVFTHNPDVINVVNSQNRSSYQYMFFDKVNGKIIMNKLPDEMKRKANVLFIDNLINSNNTLKYKKYLSLLTVRNDDDPTDYLSSVLHYDNKIVTLDKKANEYEGCSNQFLIEYIENNTYVNDLNNTSFENLCCTKILALVSVRVWLEFRLQDLSDNQLSGFFANKVDEFFRKNKNIQKNYPHLIKEQIMNKKVMLNQNCHANSQVQPFYYALSVKTDDIKNEIESLKEMFTEEV